MRRLALAGVLSPLLVVTGLGLVSQPRVTLIMLGGMALFALWVVCFAVVVDARQRPHWLRKCWVLS